MGKSIIITEGQYGLLTEGFVDLEYHFTTLGNLLSICQEDAIFLSPMVNAKANNSSKTKKFYLSLTRIRDGRVGYSKNRNVRITFDGTMLRDRFEGGPYSYWAGDTFDNIHTYYQRMGSEKDRLNGAKYDYEYRKRKGENVGDFNEFYKRHFNPNMQQHSGNESEDRLVSSKAILDNVSKYIKSVDVLLDEPNNSSQLSIAINLLPYVRHFNIKFFDSIVEFNNPNGHDINKAIEDKYGSSIQTTLTHPYNHGIGYALKDIFSFISFGNWEEKEIPLRIKEMLMKYDLQSYLPHISEYINACKRVYDIRDSYESLLNFGQRIKTRDEANAMQMLTDYIQSVGGQSLGDATRIIRNKAVDQWSRKAGHYASTRIDVMTKIPLYLAPGQYIVFRDPKTTKFNDIMGWDDERVTAEADWMANEVNYERDNGKYHTTSPNLQSLFHYLRKLLAKDSIYNVMTVLQKIGIWDEFAQNNNISFKRADMDYYDATRYDTVNSRKEEDWQKRSKIRDAEIEEWYPKLDHNK